MPHGDMGKNMNKVSVGEPADGSPPTKSMEWVNQTPETHVDQANIKFNRIQPAPPLRGWAGRSAEDRLLCKQEAMGSNPIRSTSINEFI